MTQEQLNAIRERAEMATKGPWEVCNGKDVYTELGATNNEGIEANHNDGWNITKGNGVTTGVGDEELELSFQEQNANAQFISKARQDVPDLLAEVERLRKEISFIANVDMVAGAYDVEHVAVSVKSWAIRTLEGGGRQ